MARQGNYVTVPGGSANWTKGISDSLTNLSKSFIGQGEAEDERARLKAAAEENSRRWEADKAYRKNRDSILDARASAQSAEAARRFDAQQKLARERADRENKSFKQKEDLLQAEQSARQAVWDLANPENQTFAIDDYSKPLQDSYTGLISNVELQKSATEDFLRGNSESANAVTNAYRDNLKNSGLTGPEVDRLVAQRESDLLSLKDELAFGEFTPEQKEERITNLLQETYDTRLDEIAKSVSSGMGLTQGQKTRALLDRIPSEARTYLDVADVSSLISGVVDGPTKEGLLASEKARVDAANEVTLKNIELYDDYLARANSGSSYKSNSAGIATALKDMGKVDIGWLDTADAKEGFKTLISQGISPEIAAASIAFGIDKGFVGDSFPSVNSRDFAEIELQAKQLQKGRTVGRNGRTFVDRNAYVYNPETARSLDDLLKSRVSFTPGNSNLNVNPEFGIEVPTRSVLNNRSTVNNTSASGNENDNSTDAESTDASGGEDDTTPDLLRDPEQKSAPNLGSFEELKKALGSKLDLDLPERTLTSRGMRLERPLTPVEERSVELRDTFNDLVMLREILDNEVSIGNGLNDDVIRMYQRRVNQKENELAELKAFLESQ